MIKGIIFDLDNTLCNYNESAINGRLAIFKYLKEKYSFITDDALKKAFHKSSVIALQEYMSGQINERERQIKRFYLFLKYLNLDEKEDPLFLRNLYYEKGIENLQLYPGVRETLTTLKEHFKLAILTNGLVDVQNKKLDRLGIRDYFDCIIISEEVGVDKPDPRIFKITLNCISLKEKDVIYVGDDPPFDLVGAKKAGIKVVWFNPKKITLPPQYPKPNFEIHKIEEILKIVQQLNAKSF